MYVQIFGFSDFPIFGFSDFRIFEFLDFEIFLILSLFRKSDKPLLEVITNHFLRRTNKRPEILADLITGSTIPGRLIGFFEKRFFGVFGL